jgi:phosphate-selective porin
MQLDASFNHGEGSVNSSMNLRSVKANLKGGVGQDTSYSFSLSEKNGSTSLDKAQLSYSGLNSWSSVTVGQVSMPYGLDSGSTFLEDNPAKSHFAPKKGNLGVAVNAWNDKMGFSVAVSQKGKEFSSVEDLNTSARLSFAAITRDNLTVHLGLSGYSQNAPSKEDFRTKLVHDGKSLLMSERTVEQRTSCFGLDAALLRGPVLLQAEYHHANFGGNVKNAMGWSLEGSYALTGESRSYDYRKGSFSELATSRDSGSWEVSLRHSNVRVNAEDKADNWQLFGASVGWTVNNNVKVLANYVNNPSEEKAEGALSLRVQAAW